MKNFSHLIGNEIQSVCTKFYYKENQLCFRVVVNYDDNSMYKDFESYRDYQVNHDKIIRAMHRNNTIKNDFQQLEKKAS